MIQRTQPHHPPALPLPVLACANRLDGSMNQHSSCLEPGAITARPSFGMVETRPVHDKEIIDRRPSVRRNTGCPAQRHPYWRFQITKPKTASNSRECLSGAVTRVEPSFRRPSSNMAETARASLPSVKSIQTDTHSGRGPRRRRGGARSDEDDDAGSDDTPETLGARR